MFEVRSFEDEYGQKWGEYDLYHSDHFKGISDFEKEGWYWESLLVSGGPFHTKEEAIEDANEYAAYVVEYEMR
jgi:hypothetical protein